MVGEGGTVTNYQMRGSVAINNLVTCDLDVRGSLGDQCGL